jgi:tetratricopeptide (TPR) repeat protein
MNRYTPTVICLLFAASLAIGQPVHADRPVGHVHTEVGHLPREATVASPDYVDREPPLWNNLGTLSYRITTRHEQAQRYFDQGLRFAYAFNHLEAQRAFRMAQKLDPKCAMAFWGEALVLGPNINVPMDSSAAEPALTAIHRAKALAKRASARERALIEALSKRYAKNPGNDRKHLDTAYAKAMAKVAARFPKDDQIAVLYAESMMDLSPWDYWQDGGSKAKGRTAEILKVLERVLARNPDHPGAIHYYIHMVEASDRPERAEPYARRLASLMPGAGHLVHMPFHIYFRLGRYVDALEANKAGIAADEAYILEAKPPGLYSKVYYPHNLHSLIASAHMAGDGETALAAAEKLARVVPEEAARTIPLVQPIKAAPYFAHAQFSPPATVLALPDPGSALPYVQAMWHYARGVAAASQSDGATAEGEAQAIARIGANADFSTLTVSGIPAPDILRLARLVVLGRIAQAKGDLKAARVEFERAVAVQDKLSYMEPPHWYYPVRQSLGAVRLLSGDLQGAEDAFRASLREAPNNGWSLYGLAEVYSRRDDERQADVTRERLEQAWAGDRRVLSLARL